MRVLLIEDDTATAQSIELMLKSEGFNVYTTDLGEEGVDLGKLYDYDIILLDLNLPDMSGYEVLRTLRVSKVKTPILILSGNAAEAPFCASAEEFAKAVLNLASAQAAAGNQLLRWRAETDYAALLAYVGQTSECVGQIAKLLRVPSGLTVPMLKVDPTWDKVREDAGFKALLADPKNSAPL